MRDQIVKLDEHRGLDVMTHDELVQRWKLGRSVNAQSSKELDGLTNLEALEYLEQRRKFEREASADAPSFFCRQP